MEAEPAIATRRVRLPWALVPVALLLSSTVGLGSMAIVAARDPHFFRGHGLAAHRPEVLLLWEADVVHHAESVGDHVGTKLHALEAHASQFETTMHAVDASTLGPFRDRIRERLASLGAAYGLAAAEVFARIDDL